METGSHEERAEAERERQRGPGHRARDGNKVHAIIGAADARMYAVKTRARKRARDVTARQSQKKRRHS